MAALILLVEDHQDTRQMYAEYMGLQYEVLEAGSGAEALRQMGARRPDVVITDLSMPDFDGFELVARMRGQPDLAAVPVIGLSGYGGYANEQRAREVGCALLMQKPCLPDTLANVVAEVLGASVSRRQKA
jgi:CheY-like chemotaxis protein